MARLKEIYKKEIIASLVKKFGYKNAMMAPRIEKVCLNVGVSNANNDPKSLESSKKTLVLISGQQPVVTRAKKSIASFNLREGTPIGCKVTLRGDRMYEFLDRLFNLAIPRIRDFQGISFDQFDGKGNFTLGLKEQLVFPEISYDQAERTHGLSVTIVTTAVNDDEAKELLTRLGLPFESPR